MGASAGGAAAFYLVETRFAENCFEGFRLEKKQVRVLRRAVPKKPYQAGGLFLASTGIEVRPHRLGRQRRLQEKFSTSLKDTVELAESGECTCKPEVFDELVCLDLHE